MRTAFRRCLRPASVYSCRSIPGCRYPISSFHNTFVRSLSIIPPEEPPYQEHDKADVDKVEHRSAVEDEGDLTGRKTESNNIETIATSDESAEQQDFEEDTHSSTAEGGALPGDGPEINENIKAKKGENGVAPVPDIPHWFMRHNVKTGKPKKATFFFPDVLGTNPMNGTSNRLEVVRKSKITEPQAATQQEDGHKSSETTTGADSKVAKYRISEEIMSELLATCAMGLSPQSQKAKNIFPGSKAHIILHCAADNAHIFMDKVVMKLADTMEADLIMIGPQDIAQLAANYILDDPDVKRRGLWTLGYDTGPFVGQAEEGPSRNEEAEEEEDDMDDDTAGMGRGNGRPHLALAFNLGDMTRLMGGGQPSSSAGSNGARSLSDMFNPFKSTSKILKHGNLTKLSSLLENLITANQPEMEESHPTTEGTDTTIVKHKQSRPTIIYLQNIKELKTTEHGNWIVSELDKKIKKRRDQGHRVILMGASTSTPAMSGRYRDYMEGIMNENTQTNFRTITITPLPQPASADTQMIPNLEVKTWHKVGAENGHPDTLRRVMEINFRNVFNMIKRLQPGMKGVAGIEDCLTFFRELVSEAKKDDMGHPVLRGHGQVWSVDQVHRLVSTAIGQRVLRSPKHAESHGVQTQDVLSALKLLFESDRTKIHWSIMAEANRKGLSAPSNIKGLLQNDPKTVMPQDELFQQDHETKMKEITSTANRREKQLMRGVVNAQEIRVGFDDVHATDETKEALKTVTTLALTRPDAFKYGVLANDKISGLLLYGPPGTGKTMLAKAVAKQSGATMLTVSGSDIYNMFVGEGEKNVRAVFSLAKKLAPTVVFLDEGDAILGSRGGSTERRSHRELINEFLKEWDGMNETTAFIMVATNRPFDLDDAVLRRLPRKILVDLPSERDREAILNLHLKDEILAEGVSVLKLAERTPLYSGSDLKNVAVSAALAAVREENEEAEKQGTGGEKKFPDRRVLKQLHFEKALEEISASVNEDMGSLKAIKQFDERYGDGKGRKKKKDYGFANTSAKIDTPKVRAS